MMERIFARHGLPHRIHSDNGTQFINQLITSLLGCLRIKHTRAAAYVPQQNGLVERANQTMMSHLKCILTTAQEYSDWPTYVPVVQFIMNASKHSAIGTSPHEALYGDHLSPQRNLLVQMEREVEPSKEPIPEYTKLLRERIKAIHETARSHQDGILLDATRRYTEVSEHLNAGDLVLLTYPGNRKPNKLSPTYLGPFKIVGTSENDTFILSSIVDKHTLTAHASRLRRYTGTETQAQEMAAIDSQEFVVERVIGHHVSEDTGRLMFQIRWLGYGEADDSLQPYDEDVIGNESVEDYIDSQGLRPQVEAECRDHPASSALQSI